jgi:gluconate:H+ symporter, GntP family
MSDIYPLLVLLVGIISIIGMIVILRLNAFIALITSAMLVSLLAPGALAEKISRVAFAFGSATGNIGIVIGLAVVIGQCMMVSGAADRIVKSFLALLGEKRVSVALMSSGFVLSIPVFFDTVFYLLVPLARSMYRQTGRHYLKYIMAICAGAVVTHSLVPPTPGPLIMADTFGIDMGLMILVGILISLPAAAVGLLFGWWMDRKMDLPMRPVAGEEEESRQMDVEKLPNLMMSLMPIALPVLLVSLNTIVNTFYAPVGGQNANSAFIGIISIIGNVNFAMLAATAVAMWTLVRTRDFTLKEMALTVEQALMSGGVIILITAGGGAFGAMLKAAEVGPAIESLFAGSSGEPSNGVFLIILSFLIASVMKISQGSGTVAMITTSAMMASMIPSTESLSFHPVYLATAIGGGSMFGTWMNDSAFWIFAKMGGFTEVETLKTWTLLVAVIGFTAFLTSLLLAVVLPLT